jgi:hypothetical protein
MFAAMQVLMEKINKKEIAVVEKSAAEVSAIIADLNKKL